MKLYVHVECNGCKKRGEAYIEVDSKDRIDCISMPSGWEREPMFYGDEKVLCPECAAKPSLRGVRGVR